MSIKPLTTQKIIVVHRPVLWLFAMVCVIFLLVALLWGSFEYGRNVAGFDSADADSYIQQLQLQIEKSHAEVIESQRKATMLERNSQIDGDASVQLKDTLAKVQHEALELKKELSFYKSIVAPEQGKRSLAIQSIQLKQEATGGYQYKIMVSQRGRNDRFARGTIDVSIEGVKKGQPVTYKLSEVSEQAKKPIKFGFKYFQNFEGVMILPDAFYPELLHVKVKPGAGKIKAVDEQFEWSDLTAGGV